MSTPSVAVVTGASAGVGRAIVRELAKRGMRIGLIARGIDGLTAAKREVEELGGEALVLPLDVADAAALEEAAGKVESAFGPIDYWINNAMASVFSPIKELTFDDIKRVTEVTYLGYAYGTMIALKRMLPRDRGKIIQIGSALAYRGIPLQAAYCAAKHAIQGFNDSLYSELLHDESNVKLTMINLPAINTPQFGWVKSRLPKKAQPMGEIFQPEVPARVVMWALEHDRREINVAWPTTKAVVGNNLAPGYADAYLARHGYDSQQTDEPEDPNRPHNLWEPLPGDHGAHGRFDARAKEKSFEVELNLRRTPLLLGALGLVGLTALLAAAARREKKSAHEVSG